MVCLGNICRSPLAEGILQHKAAAQGLEITVDSAGTGAFHIGKKPDVRSIEVAKRFKIDITNQRARQFKESDFYKYDLILAMDKSNLHNIQQLAPDESLKAKAKLILNYTPNTALTEVPDPYYGENDGFLDVYTMLDEACTNLINDLKNV